MKKLLTLFMMTVFVLTGCSSSSNTNDPSTSDQQQSKIEEITTSSKSDQEAYTLWIDYLNENLKSMRSETTRIRKNEDNLVTSIQEQWKKDDGIWIHRKNLDENWFRETIMTTHNKSMLTAYRSTDQKNQYKEVEKANLETSWFSKELDHMKVKKTVNEDLTTFKVYYTMVGPNSSGEQTDLPYVDEIVVNKDAMPVSFQSLQLDDNNNIIEEYDVYKTVYSHYNEVNELDEDAVVKAMKAKESQSYQDIMKEWNL